MPKTSKSRAKGNDAEVAKKPAKVDGRAADEAMDRPTLKSIVSQLKSAGSDIVALKSDTDAQLQAKVNEALQGLPSVDVLAKLSSIDPNKLVTVLGRDCLGIFIDLTDVSCRRCADASSCVAQFIANMRGKFSDLDGARADPPKPSAAAGLPVVKYSAGRAVFIRDVPNPNPKGDDYHDTIDAILTEEPGTLGELRAIVERDFELRSDADFMKFVDALRDPEQGVIKLDVDLSEDEKAELRAAGYDL